MKTKCEIFKKHKYRDKRVKMSNQTYVDQMCEKKKPVIRKNRLIQQCGEFKAVSKEKEKSIKSNIKYRLVYLQEKIPDMR